MGRLGIVAALAREADILASQVPVEGALQTLSVNVMLVRSGVGARRARTAGKFLIAEGATALMSWGSAGALDAELESGTLLLPKRILPVKGQDICVDAVWHARLLGTLADHTRVCTSPLAESTSVLPAPAAKRSLRERTKAAAVDMESAALGGLAREVGLPFLVVRAVVDAAHMSIPGSALAALDEDGRLRLTKLLARLVAAPGDWVALARLSRAFGKAQATLSQVMRQAGPDFLVPT